MARPKQMSEKKMMTGARPDLVLGNAGQHSFWSQECPVCQTTQLLVMMQQWQDAENHRYLTCRDCVGKIGLAKRS